MRFILSFYLVFLCSIAQASSFVVFEKDGFFGIKDETGNVTVPAVYEKLGWSNGSQEVIKGVIGFREKNLWGLITVRNKSLTGQKFYSIEPATSYFFKASVKGEFSNKLSYGILDSKGSTIISFNYFSIESSGLNWLVSEFDGSGQLFGMISFENEVLVPLKFKSLKEKHGLFIAEATNHKLSLYNVSGQLLESGLDSLRFENGWHAYRDGYEGWLDIDGNLIYDFDYKKIEVNDSNISLIQFPKWEVMKSDSLFISWQCDSLTLTPNGLLMAYLNGAHHLLLRNDTLLHHHELLLKEVTDHQFIVQNSKTQKWSLLSEDGIALIQEMDTLHSVSDLFAGMKNEKWSIYDRSGIKLNRLAFQLVTEGSNTQVVGKRNGHWGIVNTKDENNTFKYDSLIPVEDGYLVDYLNKWGLMDTSENWIIHAEYSEIIPFGELNIGRRGKAYTIYKGDTWTLKTAARPIKRLNDCLLVQEMGMFGLIDDEGYMLVYPEYDSIVARGEFFELRQDSLLSLIDQNGNIIIDSNEGYEEIGEFSEGYFSVKKGGKWGLVDSKGRLRISNRYDGIRPFHDQMAPVKIRKKWGFVDKNENLKVQPYYDEVTIFTNNLAVVKLNGKYGLINSEGDEVLELIWKTVRRLATDNYIVQDKHGRIGLVNSEGSFLLRPTYDHLDDFGNKVIVSKNGNWGVLDYFGRRIYEINHKEIKILKDLTFVRD